MGRYLVAGCSTFPHGGCHLLGGHHWGAMVMPRVQRGDSFNGWFMVQGWMNGWDTEFDSCWSTINLNQTSIHNLEPLISFWSTQTQMSWDICDICGYLRRFNRWRLWIPWGIACNHWVSIGKWWWYWHALLCFSHKDIGSYSFFMQRCCSWNALVFFRTRSPCRASLTHWTKNLGIRFQLQGLGLKLFVLTG